ncbi:MAG: substrate-binding domain-containing protein [Vicinamibacterales bacterium]
MAQQRLRADQRERQGDPADRDDQRNHGRDQKVTPKANAPKAPPNEEERGLVLRWPAEVAGRSAGEIPFAHPLSNLVLDLHGDPAVARLIVFSDGNHHMALVDALAAFASSERDCGEPFYATTPPRVVSEWLLHGSIRIGNLRLSTRPHVFISPRPVLDRLAASERLGPIQALARNRGAVLLVPRGNPKGLRGIADLARGDVRLFLSNPDAEKVSFEAYLQTLARVATGSGVWLDFIAPDGSLIRSPRVVLGEMIHHREAPQAVSDGRADCAVVFSHLGLRYTRVFPDRFDTVALGHEAEHVRSETHLALLADSGVHGTAFAAFMRGPEAKAIYQHHGLDWIDAS